MNQTSESKRVIAADHPSLSGHFPGNPIVPGVVLLEQVIGVIQECHPGMRVSGFTAVKFVAVLLPEQEFAIQLSQLNDHRLKFSCVVHDKVIANGQATLGFAQESDSESKSVNPKSDRG